MNPFKNKIIRAIGLYFIRSVMFMLMLFFVGKPALKICFQMLDVKTEMCEAVDEKDVEEEELDDLDEKDELISDAINELSYLAGQRRAWCEKEQLNFSDFKQGVVLPPPECTFMA